MRRTLSLAIVSALLLPLAARAQSTTPVPPPTAQQAKPHDPIEDDPAFKNLPPDEQAWMRNIRERLGKAIEDQDAAALVQIQQDIAKHRAAAAKAALPSAPTSPKIGAPGATPAPGAQSAPTGCIASPVKKPGFHIPKAMQDAINKQAKQVGKQTGVDLDPNAPAQAVKDAQKNTPCPPATPAPGQPAANK
jgi:hypothetical protein